MGDTRFLDDPLAAFVIKLSRLGQFDLACRPVKKSQSDGFFQHGNSPRQGRVWHPKRLCGFSETIGSDDFNK